MRRSALPAAALLLLVWAVPAAAQQGGLQVGVTDLKSNSSTSARVTVSVSGSGVESTQLPADAFTATLARQPAKVTRVLSPDAAQTAVSVLLVIDTSGSMSAGGNIGLAKTAASQFVDQLQPGGRVGVLRFSDKTQLVSPLTEDKDAAKASIARLQAAGDTALYDAIVAGASRLARAPGQRVIVLLSDGADTTERPIRDAINAARQNKVAIYSIGLRSGGATAPAAALRSLAKQTRGRFISAEGAQLSALYTSLGKALYSQYVVDIEVPPGTPSGSEVVVTVTARGLQASSEGRALLLDAPATTRPAALDRQAPELGRLETRQGL